MNSRRQPVLAWALIVAAVLAYPLGVLAGGLPRFPSPADCVKEATRDGNLEVVFGHFDSYAEAVQSRDEALRFGFQGTRLMLDGCERLKVALPGVPSLRVGREVLKETRSVGLAATLESEG
jgi:hypothetical protein